MRGLTLQVCPSKILERRWKQREKDIHRRKLHSVKSTIRQQYQTAPFGQVVQQQQQRNGKKEALME